jgi:hypothetical protein
MLPMLQGIDRHLHFSICWCIAWAGETSIFPDTYRLQFTILLLKLWVKYREYNILRVTSWALSQIVIPTLPKKQIIKVTNLNSVIHEKYQNPSNEFDKLTSVFVGTIIGESFDNNELIELFNDKLRRNVERLDGLNSLALFAAELRVKLKEHPIALARVPRTKRFQL